MYEEDHEKIINDQDYKNFFLFEKTKINDDLQIGNFTFDDIETVEMYQQKIITVCVNAKKEKFLFMILDLFNTKNFESLMRLIWFNRNVDLAKKVFEKYSEQILKAGHLLPPALGKKTNTLENSLVFYCCSSYKKEYFEILDLYIAHGFDIRTLDIQSTFLDPRIEKALAERGYNFM